MYHRTPEPTAQHRQRVGGSGKALQSKANRYLEPRLQPLIFHALKSSVLTLFVKKPSDIAPDAFKMNSSYKFFSSTILLSGTAIAKFFYMPTKPRIVINLATSTTPLISRF